MLPKFITDPDPEVYFTDNYITLDLETTNVDKGDPRNSANRIVFGYLTGPRVGTKEIRSISELTEYAELIYSCDVLICHFAKFELGWLRRAGLNLEWILVYDTLLGEYVRAGNRSWDLTLEATSRRYDGRGKKSVVSKMIEAGVCPSEIPFKMLREYCIQDVEETEKVFLKQREVLKEEGLLAVQFLRCISAPVITDIEMNGLFLDKELVRKYHYEFMEEYNNLIQQLNEITGGINMASSRQVAKFLYRDLGFDVPKDYKGQPMVGKPNKDFPEGQPATDEDAILSLKPKNERQREFIKLKSEESKLRRKITGYTTRFMEACDNNHCMVYGVINQTISQTHRLTSSNPNLQNIDRKLKKVITARNKGWRIRSSDYAQLEFRVAGCLAQDKQIYEDIITKYDVHSYTASIIFESEWKAAGSSRKSKKGDEIRTDAKPETFKP